ncbi:YadA C-terminal domain-containing protein [Escherichia coli]|uniref:YadA C-terminal domain-containing protein n=1 Tax=Escherichia coli TaxID=562 RepID=UPI0013630232|nr:YadA C-terminal domain-containing protein [Escherichia coli]
MNKKFTKTILSSAVAGLLLVSSGAMAAETYTINNGQYKVVVNGIIASVVNKNNETVIPAINTEIGSFMTFNIDEFNAGIKLIDEQIKKQPKYKQMEKELKNIYLNSISYPVDDNRLTAENIKNLSANQIDEIVKKKEEISKQITSTTAPAYVTAVRSGGSSDAAVAAAKDGPGVLQEYNRIVTNIDRLNKDTTFAIDANGNITLDETGSVERESVKNVVAAIQADTTIYQEEDGSYTHDVTAPKNARVSDAIVDLDKSIKDRTTVGVSSDGTLTRAEGAKNTISVNDGLVALSGRTDRIDAAVGAIDGRVTRNTQSIEKNSKAIAANTRTLQQHSARLDSQQRQINENHKEMKRAAAQSAALTGLFQPYSVGKFNATAAVGGYSDQQALAVGVGYRFNEQTAAKAGVAFSDGDASWNVGVNFEF